MAGGQVTQTATEPKTGGYLVERRLPRSDLARLCRDGAYNLNKQSFFY